ncbi:hypothetical protein BC827DRAFT_1201687 [Russula dissimulans]|nr:hypothetical protein BC827DRAFT_1201687 [Russula dissimulans]
MGQRTHVCPQWRHLILIALAHSLPLPLVIDHIGKYHGITVTAEDLLQHRDHRRVWRIRFDMPFPPGLRLEA